MDKIECKSIQSFHTEAFYFFLMQFEEQVTYLYTLHLPQEPKKLRAIIKAGVNIRRLNVRHILVFGKASTTIIGP